MSVVYYRSPFGSGGVGGLRLLQAVDGFQDRGTSARPMLVQRRNRFQNKGQTARLQTSCCKGRHFCFGIDF